MVVVLRLEHILRGCQEPIARFVAEASGAGEGTAWKPSLQWPNWTFGCFSKKADTIALFGVKYRKYSVNRVRGGNLAVQVDV